MYQACRQTEPPAPPRADKRIYKPLLPTGHLWCEMWCCCDEGTRYTSVTCSARRQQPLNVSGSLKAGERLTFSDLVQSSWLCAHTSVPWGMFCTDTWLRSLRDRNLNFITFFVLYCVAHTVAHSVQHSSSCLRHEPLSRYITLLLSTERCGNTMVQSHSCS